MTAKSEFNADEWETVVNAPIYAGLRVIMAERGGTLTETVAMTRVYQEARAHHGESELLDALVSSPPSIEADRLREASGKINELAPRELRKAMEIVETKGTPEEADGYKKFVMSVAQAVAGAHKEGGFLGFGGKPISDAENQALDEISATLGPPPAP
jgi:hypothetical protein